VNPQMLLTSLESFHFPNPIENFLTDIALRHFHFPFPSGASMRLLTDFDFPIDAFAQLPFCNFQIITNL
jgi:hypothetical protein